MKKLLIFISIFITSIYLSSAVNIVLTSWTKLDSSSWDNLSWVLNKVDVFWSNLNINWKLSVDWKICLNNGNCIWECDVSHYWDTNTNSCVIEQNWNTQATAWKTCKTILDENPGTPSWLKWIDPDWDWWHSFVSPGWWFDGMWLRNNSTGKYASTSWYFGVVQFQDRRWMGLITGYWLDWIYYNLYGSTRYEFYVR